MDSTQARKYRGSKPKGVSCRDRALNWIRENAHDGVLYFADDDNSYDIDLFEEVSPRIGQNYLAALKYAAVIRSWFVPVPAVTVIRRAKINVSSRNLNRV